MTTNSQVFAKDPTTDSIPNSGVSKVQQPENDSQWRVLRHELTSFVCSGEYERGLEKILGSYLSHLSQFEQPAVWVSGFYGSGKSHLCGCSSTCGPTPPSLTAPSRVDWRRCPIR